MGTRTLVTGLAILVLAGSARADRILVADDYRDKLAGMWLGEIVANYAGRSREGAVARGGLTGSVPWVYPAAALPWDGDDDTLFEFMYAQILKTTSDPTPAQLGAFWTDHVALDSFWWANKQARYLMEHGETPPGSGSRALNHTWYAIDSQITTEAIGVISPGMRERAADLVGRFASITNDGFAVHAAQFYGAMYSAAAFETDVHTIVAEALEIVPRTSRSYQIVQDVRDWYAADLADDGITDWRATQAMIWDKYGNEDGEGGRYLGWVESSVNLACTTMAILYGEGDFATTVEIGVLGGFDADCNAATAGGLVGMVSGYSALEGILGAGPDRYVASWANPSWIENLDLDRLLLGAGGILDDWVQAVERQIVYELGGTIVDVGGVRTYVIPDEAPIGARLEMPDPAGPRGLVGQILALGGSVAVSASVAFLDPTHDAHDLLGLIDGIVDNLYNGHLSYRTDDGANPQPAGGDWYQIDFDRDVLIDSVIFHEGALFTHRRYDPREWGAFGGYFTDLVVEVRRDGVWTMVGSGTDQLDMFEQYQTIAIGFDPVTGDAIRIRGTAGGYWEFTSIMELEVFGRLLEAPSPGEVPEPGAAVLVLLGAGLLAAVRRRRPL